MNIKLGSGFNKTRWLFIVIFLGITIFSAFCKSDFVGPISPIITIVALFTAVWLHGTARYGFKNMLIFFLITWLVSNFFEALSIRTGFPFGHYYYDALMGPRLFDVPLIIMFAYFATGYSAWILSHILLGQNALPLKKKYLFFIPLIASFLMVMWDLCIDPLCSTVASFWVWKDGGPYFGVPLQNYFGWFLVVYIIYQLFAIYLSKYEKRDLSKNTIFASKIFWVEIITLYAIQGLTQVLQFTGTTKHHDIYASMALVSVFSMMFVALIALILLFGSKKG